MFQTYIENPYVRENSFQTLSPETAPLPIFAEIRSLLPQPFWDGHPSEISAYWRAWELAWENLRQPTTENGFVANYIDTAFNGHLFLWDSVFILLFGRYGHSAFDFQRTLDNFYVKQHPDGFICREIDEADGTDCFARNDPASTGPNVFAWAEWEHYRNFADKERLTRVFPVLIAYHHWLRANHTWQDGSYWTCGWGCGMDNQPRAIGQYPAAASHSHQLDEFSHGHLSWVDACCQQALSARIILLIGAEIGREAETDDFAKELTALTSLINDTLWDEQQAFYCDRTRDGTLLPLKTIGAYWALLAGVVPPERVERFLSHFHDPATFCRPHQVPTLSADHAQYDPAGGYWLGGVWPPTNYMVLRGLSAQDHADLAHKIGCNHVEFVTTVFRDTETFWENYAPERAMPGQPAKPDFVGWSGLGPIAVLFEYVFGLRPEAGAGRLIWDVRLTEEHGIQCYPFGAQGRLDLLCRARQETTERPDVSCLSNIPVEVEIRWNGPTFRVAAGPGTGNTFS
ncbi:MAG: MGH1-like glycoside hydrolase domain-containing protein [Janthinobacterium lividum]